MKIVKIPLQDFGKYQAITITSNFITDRKINSYKYETGKESVHVCETTHIKGEPGSAGNWSPEIFEEVLTWASNLKI